MYKANSQHKVAAECRQPMVVYQRAASQWLNVLANHKEAQGVYFSRLTNLITIEYKAIKNMTFLFFYTLEKSQIIILFDLVSRIECLFRWK